MKRADPPVEIDDQVAPYNPAQISFHPPFTMKIHQLPLGARFEYEGEAYVKTGPLLATGKQGQKLIPKYAVLKVLGETASRHEESEGTLSRKVVLEAFNRFHASCEAIVQIDKQAELRAARDAFMQSIGCNASTRQGGS